MPEPQTPLELVFVAHSHWDREWYLPFQLFRARLVRMIDRLLRTMEADPAYTYFMLDGQTVVLEDYLEVRPEREAELRRYISGERLLAGPWYVQPDEFLVSGEALIRNLLRGHRIANRFGGVMKVGYIPDPFGQVSQMPQILLGFGMDSAVFWRGASDDVTRTEFRWQAPDGSSVFTIFMPYGYCNAQPFSFSPAAAHAQLAAQRETLTPQLSTPFMLMMNGNDHVEPSPAVPAILRNLEAELRGEGMRLRLGTLAQLIAGARRSLAVNESVPSSQITHVGEFRWSRRSKVLPGVLSARMWIKQANSQAQALLERASEPLAAWQWALLRNYPPTSRDIDATTYPEEINDRLSRNHALTQLAWKYLLQCQPHDSICGSGVDEVHEEMRTRFANAMQVGEEVAELSLITLADYLDSAALHPDGDGLAVIVYNQASARREVVTTTVPLALPQPLGQFTLHDESGAEIAYTLLNIREEELLSMDATPQQAIGALAAEADGKVANMIISEALVQSAAEPGVYNVDILATEVGVPNVAAVQAAARLLDALISAGEATRFRVRAHKPAEATIRFVADLPAYGYRTYLLRPGPLSTTPAPLNVQQVAAPGRNVTPAPATLMPLPATLQHETTRAFHLPATIEGVINALPRGRRVRRVVQQLGQQPLRRAWQEAMLYTIANEFFRVTVDQRTGWLTVTAAQTGRVLVECGNRLVDGGDAGDEYNYSPPAHDILIDQRPPRSAGSALPEVAVSVTPTAQQLTVRYNLRLPARLSPDRRSRSHELVDCPIVTTISLYPGLGRVDISTTVDNWAEDHRLRVAFDLPVASEYSFAESAFDVVRRPTALPAFDSAWLEQPQPTHPQQSFCAAGDGRLGLLLANRGLPEYEVASEVGKSTIYLTLLRCVGWLSRADLPTRPGHAGPGLATPAAQMLGSHSFEYAIVPHQGDWLTSRAYAAAHHFTTPPRTIATRLHHGPLPLSASLIEIEPPELVISSIKRSEDGNSLIVRAWNIGEQTITARLRCHFPFATAHLASLEEVPGEELTADAEGWHSFNAGAKQIVTIMFGMLTNYELRTKTLCIAVVNLRQPYQNLTK